MVFLTRLVLSKPNAFLSLSFKEMVYYSAGFHKYGLMRDDLRIETPEVLEALRRIPQEIRDERNFRIIRAMLVNSSHSILPKEQWMSLEKDVLYLTPYLDEVMKEIKEKEDWNKE